MGLFGAPNTLVTSSNGDFVNTPGDGSCSTGLVRSS